MEMTVRVNFHAPDGVFTIYPATPDGRIVATEGFMVKGENAEAIGQAILAIKKSKEVTSAVG